MLEGNGEGVCSMQSTSGIYIHRLEWREVPVNNLEFYFGDGYCIVKKFGEFSTAYAFASVFCFEPKEKNSSM